MCLNDGFDSSVERFFTLTAIGVVAALHYILQVQIYDDATLIPLNKCT